MGFLSEDHLATCILHCCFYIMHAIVSFGEMMMFAIDDENDLDEGQSAGRCRGTQSMKKMKKGEVV
jgi:hypothetical protein